MTFFEGRCLACWRIPDEVGITECCFGCLVTCWLSSYLEKKRSQKMVFTFQRRQYFRQDPPWHSIHSWGPSYFNRVGVFLQLDFSVILHPSLAVWMEQWRVYSAVYLPVYWCQNEQRCCCTWKLSSISWEKIFLYTTSRLSLWESFMRNYVLVWSVSEGWGSLAWYVFNPQSIHVQC